MATRERLPQLRQQITSCQIGGEYHNVDLRDSMKEYYVCIATDLVKSKNEDYFNYINLLVECADKLNEDYKENLVIPFKVRNGDEIVGVLKDFSLGYDVLLNIIQFNEKHKINMRTGIGFGDLKYIDKDVHKINGSSVLNAFSARDEYLKKNHREAEIWTVGEGYLFFFYSDLFTYQAINSLAYLILDKKSNWTDKQKEIIKAMEEDRELTYEEIGAKVSYERNRKENVSKMIDRAQYKSIREAEKSLKLFLKDIQRLLEKGE